MEISAWLMGHKDHIEVVSNIAVIFAGVAGGFWALFRFIKERTDEEAISLAVSHNSYQLGKKDDYVVAIRVEIANKGKTKVQAKTKTKKGYSFDDGDEKLHHAFSLQIRRFSTKEAASPRHIDWFEPSIAKSIPGMTSEINLLTEYEDPENDNTVNFWLEPSEVYNLERPVVLPAGVYLGKVTFVASGGDDNFWSRVFAFAVPGATESASSNTEEK